MTAIRMDLSAVLKTKWYEYAIRFVFGGLITVSAGLIAERFGPTVGGLLLAFPAIFPASATLVEKHEKEKKAQAGLDGTVRGCLAASLDARGAAMGSIALMFFAFVVWNLLGYASAWIVLGSAVIVWLAVSILLWYGRRFGRA
jgi:hypothetical protein